MERAREEIPTFEKSLDGTQIESNGFTAHITDPALLLDEQGKVLSVNAPARQLLDRCEIKLDLGDIFDQDISHAKEILLPTPDHVGLLIEIHPTTLNFDGRSICLLVLREITQKRWRELEASVLSEITACLQETMNRRQMMLAVMDKLMGLMKFQSFFFAFQLDESGEIVVEFARGWKNQVVGLRFTGENCVLNQVMKNGEVYLNNHLDEEDLAGCPGVVENHHSCVILPLKAGKETIGVFGVFDQYAISDQEEKILHLAAWLIGIAYHRVRLNEDNQNNLNRLTALRMIGLAVSVSLDLNITLNLLLDQVTSQLNADAADIYLRNAERDELELVASNGFWHPELLNARLSHQEGIIGKMVNQKKVLRWSGNSLELDDIGRKDLFRKEKFVCTYVVPLVTKGTVNGVLELYSRRVIRADAGWMRFLEAISDEAAVAIDNTELFRQLQHSHDELALAYDATIQGWSKTLELRDLETKGHSDRVVELTLALSRKLNVPEEQMTHLRRGALLHDIGKMGIPDSILLKPGPLSDEEITVMHKHPEYAMRLLVSVPFLRPALDIPYCHHEKWNGSGYPRGLKGEEIPLAARIFSVVDVYDALRYERPYRDAWSKKRALDYIREKRGVEFDPGIVDAFFEVVNHVKGE